MGVREKKRTANRQRILDVAADLFFEHGYAGTTMDAICEALNATKPFVYHYFKDKSEILDTLSLDSARVTLGALHIAEGRHISAEGRLRVGLRQLLESHVRLFKPGSLYYRDPTAHSAKVRKQIRDMEREFHQQFVTLLEDAMKEGVIPQQNVHLTALTIGGIVGFMHTWYQPNGYATPDEIIEHLLQSMLRAAGVRLSAARSKAQPQALHGVVR